MTDYLAARNMCS